MGRLQSALGASRAAAPAPEGLLGRGLLSLRGICSFKSSRHK